MAMRLLSPSTPPPLFPNPGPKPPASAAAASSYFSLRLRRARAAAAAGVVAAGVPERDGGRFEGEAMGGAFDRGLAEIARKVPLFEPATDGELAAAAGERPLPINLELWLYRAKVHTRKFEFPEAEKLLDKCISFWPEDGRPYVALGKLYSKQSRFDKARAVYERGCQATQGENPYIWQCWAVLESKGGNIRRARELFDAATVADAKHIAAWHGWAILEIKQGNIKKARNLLGKALKYCGGNEYIYQTLALLEARAERFEQARTLFQQATRSNPKSCASWLAWAQVEMRAGNNTMARKLFEKAVQSSPKNRFSWHIWALFEANEGNIDRARKLLKIGHAVNPRDPVILQSLALLEYNYSSANVARVLFRKASQIDPRHQPVWIAWGWMEWKEGNVRTARTLYQRALSVNSTNECAARCLQAWGVLEQRAGNYTAARRLLRSSLSINSQSEVTWMTWAALEEEQGDPVRAEEIRNLYFQQRTEVVDDASWVMGFLDIIDPALDSVKKLLNLDQPSGPARQDIVKSTADPSSPTIRSSAAGEYSESSTTGGSDTSVLSSNDGKDKAEAAETPESTGFDLDGFIKKRLSLDPAELDAVLEGSDPRGVVSQRRKRRLPRKPLPLLPVP
ncbi:protein high chlorophyll fluorescent 107-like [Phragmites australis]|uniref:protein high chlorophyll fluorescent 107-like n=1 Tax=Phragmites australis TaxID=29695 RepID=UPI002D77D925|nr:protein high chlorophyll fluorescent 107-like [Phragmites australis]